MNVRIKKLLQFMNLISFILAVIFMLFGYVAETLNPPVFEELTYNLSIPLSIDQIFLVGYVSIAVFLITHVLRKL